MADATLLITDDAMLDHNPGLGHPERADRLRAILRSLRERRIEGVAWATPRPATLASLQRAHNPQYVETVELTRGHPETFDQDTASSAGTVQAAELAAGSVIDAVEAVMGRGGGGGGAGGTRAFALCRPPGHHAEANRAMGFCFFANVAIGALHAISEFGLERVLVLDWDVHHGNGTQHILESRPEVLFISLHQHPFYPGTGGLNECGHGAGEGYTVNVPMPAGCADEEYLAIFDDIIVPIADAYAPQLVLVSAGFDAHAADPLAGMRVSTEGFRTMCAKVRGVADRHAGGRLVLALEGGYDLESLVASVRACVEDLTGVQRGEESDAAGRTKTSLALIGRVRDVQAPYWGEVLGGAP